MNFTYPKQDKLKSRTLIDKLFTEGRSVSKYPLRLVYAKPENPQIPFQLSVSVSKKYFKKAVDRNYFKRVLRECYRLNQDVLKSDLQEPYIFMLFYQSKERLEFEEIQQKTIELFKKFHAQNSKSSEKTSETNTTL